METEFTSDLTLLIKILYGYLKSLENWDDEESSCPQCGNTKSMQHHPNCYLGYMIQLIEKSGVIQ